MKRALIFCNGQKPQKNRVTPLLSSPAFVICADGGTKHALSFGIKPDVIIGDLDSLSPLLQKKLRQEEDITFVTFAKEKNETDSELAVEYAKQKGYSDITIFGISGTRIDHFLGTLLYLSMQKNMQIRIVVGNQIMYMVTGRITILGKKSDILSLIPLHTDVEGVSTVGLLYSLHKSTLTFGKTRGVSNEFITTTAEITLEKGVLLVIHTPHS